jgi:type II secretory pathway pseudopilin PulG
MSAGQRQRAHRLHACGEAGFSIVEVTVAALLLALMSLAVLGLVDAANRNNYRASQSQVVNDRLQQEMERIRALPYDQIALTGAPASATNPSTPNSQVNGTQFDVDRGAAAHYEDLVYNGGHANETGDTVSGGQIPVTDPNSTTTSGPFPTSFRNGNVSGTIYRYVTWEPDTSCSNCAHDPDADSYNGQSVQWFKHVIVAIALDQTATGGARLYQQIDGDVGNPNAGLNACPENDPGCTNPGGTNQTPWTFWLTDTPCSSDSRQPITGAHDTHNTLDGCSTGMTTGAIPGAPDLMFTRSAPLDEGDQQPPTYDYANDVEPGCGTNGCDPNDRGLQMKTPPDPTGLGCSVDPRSVTSLQQLGSTPAQATPWLYIHKWVSPAIPNGFDPVVLDGTGVLNLWTQSIAGNVASGQICVWLFTRHLESVDTLAVNLGGTQAQCRQRPEDLPQENCCPTTDGVNLTVFTCSFPNNDWTSQWPSGGWTEVHIPLHFGQLSLPAGDRLGLAVGISAGGTAQSSGLQFMYDHPSFDSRLEVHTGSLLPVFGSS